MASIQPGPLQSVAERVIARYLERTLSLPAQVVSNFGVHNARGVDIVYTTRDGIRHAIKVKGDPYFGTEQDKISDRSLSFYRADAQSFSFATIADAQSKTPGWILASDAEDIYYYFLAIAQEEAEVVALLQERDEVFFSEIAIERDELVILPMAETREWFREHADRYPSRPVFSGSGSAWERLIPRSEVQRAVKGARIVGPVFRGVAL